MRIKIAWWFLLILVNFLTSCQHKQNHQVVVGIFCINDFHGAFLEDKDKGIPGVKNILYTLDSLKSVYPHHATISAGDNYGGSYLYKILDGKPLPLFFHAAGIEISAVGNHEFNDKDFYNPEILLHQKTIVPQTWNLTYICANATDSLNSIPNGIKPFECKTIRISETCSLDIAFLGLTTATTNDYLNSKTNKVKIASQYAQTLEQIKQYEGYSKVDSADIRFIVAHIGARHENGHTFWTDAYKSQLDAISDTTIHGIFSGHEHSLLNNRINKRQYPITQAGKYGSHIAVMKVVYDTLQDAIVSVIPEICKVNIHDDVKTTSNFERALDSLLHNVKVGEHALGKVLCQAKADLHHNKSLSYSFTELGHHVCNAYAFAYQKATQADANDSLPIIGLTHFGSIRNDLRKGAVTVLDAGSALPYANKLRAFRLNGLRLKRILSFGLNNHRFGWLQPSCIEIHCDNTESLKVNRAFYQSPAGQHYEIKDDKPCIVVVDEYIVNGGDYYRTSDFPVDREIPVDLPSTTEAFIQHLQHIKTIGGDSLATLKLIINGKRYRNLQDINKPNQ